MQKFTKQGERHDVHYDLPEAVDFFQRAGASLDVVDVQSFAGLERIVDLNELQDLGQYDLVIDPGTTEHCFNIGVAMLNAANAVKVGGRIAHTPPMTMVNHGFYNLCPTMLFDFYTQNDWEIEVLEARLLREPRKVFNLIASESATRRASAGKDLYLTCVAKRKTDQKLKWPTQTKYLTTPSLSSPFTI